MRTAVHYCIVLLLYYCMCEVLSVTFLLRTQNARLATLLSTTFQTMTAQSLSLYRK